MPGCADDGEDTLARALKRPRLVWTPKLHQRFIEAVEQLGLKVAVPKTIMQVRPESAADCISTPCSWLMATNVMTYTPAEEGPVTAQDCPGPWTFIRHVPVQMMNVEGLTRENVASHLQKFRLQLKRENKLDDEGNLLSPLKGSKLGGSEEDVHGSATSQDRDGGGAKGSSPSSDQVEAPPVSPG